LRRISFGFMIIFSVEIILVIVMSFWVINITAGDESKRAEIFSSLFAASGSILLTSALVYHNYWQRPELKIMDIIIDPLNAHGQNVADKKYRSFVFVKDPTVAGGNSSFYQTRPKVNNGFLEVKSSQFCKMRVATDVCNVGVSETTIHEYRVKEIKPIERLVGVYCSRETLPHQKRITLDFNYPEGKSTFLERGNYEFEIEVIAATEKKSRRIMVIVPDDFKTIRWRQLDC